MQHMKFQNVAQEMLECPTGNIRIRHRKYKDSTQEYQNVNQEMLEFQTGNVRMTHTQFQNATQDIFECQSQEILKCQERIMFPFPLPP